jgi:hypothetical protein
MIYITFWRCYLKDAFRHRIKTYLNIHNDRIGIIILYIQNTDSSFEIYTFRTHQRAIIWQFSAYHSAACVQLIWLSGWSICMRLLGSHTTVTIHQITDWLQWKFEELLLRFISFHFILFSIHICYYSNTWTSHNVWHIIPGIHLPSGRGLKFVNSNHNVFITYNLDKKHTHQPKSI